MLMHMPLMYRKKKTLLLAWKWLDPYVAGSVQVAWLVCLVRNNRYHLYIELFAAIVLYRLFDRSAWYYLLIFYPTFDHSFY